MLPALTFLPNLFIDVSKSLKDNELAKVNNKMDWIFEKIENLILSMIAATSLAICKRLYLELVMHTSHHYLFVKICENIAINVDALIIQTWVFIVKTDNHLLILGQLFLYKGKFSQQYLADSVYSHLTDYIKMRTVIFSILGPNN